MNNELASTVPPTAPAAATTQPPSLTIVPGPAPTQTRASKPKARNGIIAHLPKLERDMVSRMLSDAIPHKKIAEALAQRGFKVTPRNISNWATRGGYHQWRLDQALLLQTRLDQDTLTDFLRDDPTRLPEVGLQLMATRFSQIILRSELDPKQSLPLVAMLCRVSHEILKLHKFRDVRRTIGHPGYQFERENKDNTKQIEILRKTYSGQPVENEPSPPKYTILDLIRAMRKGPQDAATVLAGLEPSPPHHSAPAQAPAANPKPPQPVRVPKPARKPKSKTNTPTPPAPAPTPSPAGKAGATQGPQIENQNSKIKNPAGEGSDRSQVNGEAPSAVSPQIENQNSKIKNSPGEGSDRSQVNGEAPSAVSPQIENQNSKIKNSENSLVEITPLRTPLRFIDNVPQPPPPQHCPYCLTPLEYFPDGSPPLTTCPKCNLQLENLYGQQIERCPACNIPLPPLLPDGLRPSPTCAVCGCGLPNPATPGPHPPPLRINSQVCPFCRTPIPWSSPATRPPYCAQCHRHHPRVVYNNPDPVPKGVPPPSVR